MILHIIEWGFMFDVGAKCNRNSIVVEMWNDNMSQYDYIGEQEKRYCYCFLHVIQLIHIC